MPREYSKKRNRITFSCNYCKQRNVKCDRGQPCTSRVKHNVAGLCEYNNTFDNDEIQHVGELPPFSVQKHDDSHNRIERSRYDINTDVGKRDETDNNDPVHTELAILKDKI